jgi:malonyl-CoA O-methyltransferase
MDVEHIRISYREIDRLFADLRAIAATNRIADRRKGLTSPRLWQKMLAAGDALKNADGSFPVNVELITGQAWMGEAGPGVGMTDGEANFPLSRLSRRNGN